MITCYFKQLFGIDCPGCGIQRSFVCLLRGEFLDSLALFPALIPFIMFSTLGILTLFKNLKINQNWIIGFAIVTFSIMLIHFLLKVAGLAPWYDNAASNF